MLANPFYYGDIRTRGHIVAGKHQPIIERPLWDAFQKIRGLRVEKFEVRNAKFIPKPYMGLVQCGVCGHAITGESKRSHHAESRDDCSGVRCGSGYRCFDAITRVIQDRL